MRHTLILVLSAMRTPWKSLMDAQRSTWDSIEHPQTTTLYYVGRPTYNVPEPRTIYSQFDEELHNIGRRTVEAYEHALMIPHWEYIARVHSSTYVHKGRLVDFVESLPERDQLLGLIADSNLGFKYLWGGGHFILSRDVVERIVANKDKWNHSLMEDGAQSRLALDLGIQLGVGRSCSINPSDTAGKYDCVAYNGKRGGFSASDFSEITKLEDQFFFRVKHDRDRSEDVLTMKFLFDYLPR